MERLERTLGTLDELERHRGHFYNWYDTGSLVPLEPRYVSTVDSGNLAGHLLTAAEACREFREGPVRPGTAAEGIADAVRLARGAAEATADRLRGGTVSRHDLEECLRRLEAGLASPPEDADGWVRLLDELREEAEALEDMAAVIAEQADGGNVASLAYWATAVRRERGPRRSALRIRNTW